VQEAVRKIGTRRTIIFLGVSMAVLFLASGLLSTEASAQTTSPEGKIVFVKQDPVSDSYDIWVMDADGTNQINLTNTPDTNEGQPAWSSDGTKIAFTGAGDLNEDGSGGLGDIYVMDADGTNKANLTNTPDFLENQPSWAPSGGQLTFVREVPGQIISEQQDIFVMDTDPATNDAINLTQTDESEKHPAWSPDGAKIAFSGVRNGGEEILTMDPDGQNEEILTGDGSDAFDEAPDWSPDGTKVVFQKQSQMGGCCGPWEIWGVNRDGSGHTNLTPTDLSEDDRPVTQHTGPSWSPDGSEITFTRTRPSVEGGQSDIYAMPAPTTLPPPTGESASTTTTMEQGEGVMVLAESTLVRRLTTDGLSSEPDWADTPADTTPPKVKSTSPANGATQIAPGVNVTATFTEAMDASPTATDGDPSTITGTTFKLMKAGTTTAIGAVVSYNATSNKATLNPNANLQLGTKYKAVVTTGAQDLAGNRLDQNPTTAGLQQKAWTFTIRN
jgi:Tol biopolymer transport system component